jgi:putative acetyltransferase
MIKLVRTDSSNHDFRKLVEMLDRDLLSRYGAEQSFFAQFNSLDTIKNVIVAYSDTIPVGCGAFKLYADRTAEIKRMFVSGEFRGQGIGRSIIHALEAWASELKYTDCILETGTYQPEAIALYLKIGFTVTENYGQYVGIDRSVCMHKALIHIE